MRTALVTAVIALGLTALVGCEPDTPKAANQEVNVPPPVNSTNDKMKQPRTPAKPGGLAPPKRGGSPS